MRTAQLPCIAGLLILGGLATGGPFAQDLATGSDLRDAIHVLNSAPARNSLPCYIEFSEKPRLDYLFRYSSGFLINCRLGSVILPGAKLLAVLQITPQPGRPVVLTEEFDVPPPHSHGASSLDAAPTQLQASMAGGFATGPGRYLLEIVLTDGRGHTYRKQWKFKSGENRADRDVPFTLANGAVAPLFEAQWNGALSSKGLHLTVLLHTYSAWGGARLYAWDRAYLLQSLATLLNQLPCESVKLIAFNLEKQEEVFSQEDFDSDGFAKLSKALEQADLYTMPYKALLHGTWAKFLVDLEQRRATSGQSPDAIIFLGAWGSHEWDKLPKDMMRKLERSDAQIFYFQYFPYVGAAPDGVEVLTRNLHGSVFTIRTPAAFAQAIKKTQALVSGSSSD